MTDNERMRRVLRGAIGAAKCRLADPRTSVESLRISRKEVDYTARLALLVEA